jgi:hypothetical protein
VRVWEEGTPDAGWVLVRGKGLDSRTGKWKAQNRTKRRGVLDYADAPLLREVN